MNTKLLFLTIIVTILLSIHVQAASDGDEYVSFDPDPNDDSYHPDPVDNEEKEEEEKVQNVANDSPFTSEQGDKSADNTLNEDDSQPDNEKIHQAAVIADGTYQTFTMDRCEFVLIMLEKKATKIEANAVFNLASFIVTSTPFVDCDDITEYDCPDEGFCEVREFDKDDSPIELNKEACEVDVLYLYPIPLDTSAQKMTIEVQVTMGDVLDCDATSTSTATSATKDSQETSEQTPSGLQHPVSKIIGIILLTTFTLFVVVVCFYRCQFRKNGTGPFTPPSFCPGFLFPRQKMSGFTAIGVDRRQELADYEPPVPVL